MADTPAPARRPRRQMRTVTAARVERHTPHLIRVTFGGEPLEGFASKGPAEHIRIWFPQPGYDAPVMPEWTGDGPVMPEGHERPDSRVYTPRRFDAAARELTVDFVVHGDGGGPGSRWATAAAPGSTVVLAGPSGPYAIDAGASRFILAADHAGLPAAATVLEALPEGAEADAVIEVPGADDELALASRASLTATWLQSGDAPVGDALTAHLRGLALEPDPGLRIFVACEAGTMRDIRRHLLHERGFDRSAIHTHGYWKRDTANHPDHDLGEEI